MAKLEGKVNPKAEKEFHLKTKDFLRPSLKQIGNSIDEIKQYFQEQGVITVVPSRPHKDLQDINDDLMSRITEDAFLFKENIVKGASSETCEDTAGLVLLTNSFGPTFNLPTLPQTLQHLCDIFLAVPQQPPMLLTVIDAFPVTKDVKDYNAHLARELTTKLRLFTSESVNFVRGIISRSDLKDGRLFQTRLQLHASLSSIFPPKSSFSMNLMKYDQVMTAFWAVVAETNSVVTDNGDVNHLDIHFLTKQQCVVLVENMNSKHVQVRCEPGSGATTLMLEVTRRLSRLGETLLVCRSREDTDRLRPVYPSIISLEEAWNRDLSKFENIVHDTHTVLHETNGRHWQFLTETSMAELRRRVTDVETVVMAMENQLEAMKCENWKQRMDYTQSEMDVLKLFRQLAVNTISHETDIPGKCLSGDISLSSREPDVAEPHLRMFMDRIEDRKDLFPILGTFIKERKIQLMYLRSKMTFLEKATMGSADKDHEDEQYTLQAGKHGKAKQQNLNPGKAEKGEKQRQKQKHKRKYSRKQRHRRSSREDEEDCAVRILSKQHPSAVLETQTQLPNPRSEEPQWPFDGTEKLQERLETLEKARGENILQLIPLVTVEWQNTLNYLKTHTTTLSWFGVDTRGFDYDQRERHDPFVFKTRSRQEDQENDQTDTKSKKGMDAASQDVASVAKEVDSTRASSISHPMRKTRCKEESSVYQLRKFQLGRLNVRCIYEKLGQIAAADNDSIADLQDKTGHMEKVFGCPLHVVGELDSPRCHPVSCPPFYLDAKRANQRRCHVTADGKLVNSPPAMKAKNDTGLEEYSGTCSDAPILLPEHVTGRSGSLPVQYWETHTNVGVVGGQGWPPILEMGLSEAGLVDSRTWICNQPRSWCVTVWRCKKHGGKICTRAYQEGDWEGCRMDTMSDIPGTKATLCYGLVLDVERGRVAFIDLNREVVLARYDVRFKETVFPMFGVWRRSEDFSVEMKLISGVDITMTDAKRTLIYQSLK